MPSPHSRIQGLRGGAFTHLRDMLVSSYAALSGMVRMVHILRQCRLILDFNLDMSLPRLFVLFALPLEIFLVILLPLGEAPDEATQVARAASVLQGQWIGHRMEVAHHVDQMPITMAGVDINLGYLTPFLSIPSLHKNPREPVSREELQALSHLQWYTGKVFVEASNTASYIPIFYLPSALGLGIASVFGVGPVSTILVGRMANALCSLLIGYLALQFARRSRPALFALLALPISLHLSAAVNQDGPLIASAALASALFSRKGRGHYWSGVTVLSCVIAAKPPYLPLALAALVPLDGTIWLLRRHGLGFLIVVAVGLGWAGTAAGLAVVPFWRPPYHPGPLWSGDPTILFRSTDSASQLQVLLNRPSLLISLPIETLVDRWHDLASSAVGVLGWLDLILPAWCYRLWYFALAAAAGAALVAARETSICVSKAYAAPQLGASVVILCSGAMCVYGLILLQYLSWTNVGSTTVEGMQGRYLLPVLAMLISALPVVPLPTQIAQVVRTLLSVPVICAALIGLGVLPFVTVMWYYVG